MCSQQTVFQNTNKIIIVPTHGIGRLNLYRILSDMQMDQTPKRIAAKWIEYTLRCNPETGDLKGRNPLEFENEDEGVQDLIELVCSNQSSALAVVDEILNQSSDPWVLVNLGAGPFEDLLSMGKMTHVPAIEALVKKYPHAREVMQHVWMSRFSPEVRAECERIISENL